MNWVAQSYKNCRFSQSLRPTVNVKFPHCTRGKARSARPNLTTCQAVDTVFSQLKEWEPTSMKTDAIIHQVTKARKPSVLLIARSPHYPHVRTTSNRGKSTPIPQPSPTKAHTPAPKAAKAAFHIYSCFYSCPFSLLLHHGTPLIFSDCDHGTPLIRVPW